MRFFSVISDFSVLLICTVGITLLLTGCGRKAPLYIPTQAQAEQMKKAQVERDAVLKARAERKKQHQTKQTQATDKKQETP